MELLEEHKIQKVSGIVGIIIDVDRRIA